MFRKPNPNFREKVNNSLKKGFTLIELLIVIAIIGLLSAIIIPRVHEHIERARIARSKTFRHAIMMTIGIDKVGSWPLEREFLDGPHRRTHDMSGWGNVGTFHQIGLVPYPPFVPGVIGNTLRFGWSNAVIIPGDDFNFAGTQPFTVEAWINIAVDHGGFIVSRQNFLVASQWYFRLVDRRIVMARRDIPEGWMVAKTTLSLNRWYHVVGIYDGTNKRIFLDTVLDGGPQSSGSLPSNVANVCIGCVFWNHSPGFYFHGLIDEVRIFRAAMPASYIQKRYVQGIKSLAINGGITQEEKNERLTALQNSGQLVTDLDAALVGPIDFSVYEKYLNLEVSEVTK